MASSSSEDAIFLYATHELTQVPTRVVGCLGPSIENDVSHNEMLENMAALMKAGGCLGGCSLTLQIPAYKTYEDAVLYVQGKRYQDPSVINSCIILRREGSSVLSCHRQNDRRQIEEPIQRHERRDSEGRPFHNL